MASTKARSTEVSTSTVNGQRRRRSVSRAGYLEAKLGFRNYWYPAVFSRELDDGQAIGVRLLGENILIRRVGDRTMAVADRCLHRGVRFSRKPECYTADTITCWYHGFTYRLSDGKLVEILTEPGSSLIGKTRAQDIPGGRGQGYRLRLYRRGRAGRPRA